MQPEASIILTTYNWPEALALVLDSLAKQKTSHPFEVIIADDGSNHKTRELIKQIKVNFPYPLKHLWQEDQGFRAAKCRNKAVALSSSDYLIFLDGDCITPPLFIDRQLKLKQKGYFVGGNRVLLSANFTTQVLEKQVSLGETPLFQWLTYRLQGKCNRCLPLFYLPLNRWRTLKPKTWKGVKTCNMALFKQDFIATNGFDEAYEGWGYEDSDLVIRLINRGITHKSGRFALPVFHLYHPEAKRDQEKENLKRLKKLLNSDNTLAALGVNQYL